MNPGSRYVLGVSAFYHDSAACLLRDGDIVAAAQEERFTRSKGDATFPRHAVAYCLTEAGIQTGDLQCVAFYDKPLLKFERILETYLAIAPRGFGSFLRAGPLWIKEKLITDRQRREALGGFDGTLVYPEHHESHAASAFFPSPFQEAAVLTIDGVGEWATAAKGVGRGSELTLGKELRWPDSLGLLHSAFTYYTGFKVNSGEYKVMGLAPYGQPKYVDLIYRDLLDLKPDGSFVLRQKYFNYLGGLTMTSREFDELFGGPPRVPERKLTQKEMDLARSVQVVCEEIVLRMVDTLHRDTGMENLCLAGGVALNCVANGRVLREGPPKRIWIQPAAGDAGGAVGAAQLAWHRHLGEPRRVTQPDGMRGALLGRRSTKSDRSIPCASGERRTNGSTGERCVLRERVAQYFELDADSRTRTAASCVRTWTSLCSAGNCSTRRRSHRHRRRTIGGNGSSWTDPEGGAAVRSAGGRGLRPARGHRALARSRPDGMAPRRARVRAPGRRGCRAGRARAGVSRLDADRARDLPDTTPIVLGIMYFLVITPIGLLLRATGQRPLSHDRGTTAWTARSNPGSDLKRQF